ncbi:UNVERIFIED_CONTAM: K(+) efflux antiporter 5 [Sesamum radiatum]|uniref:K(+) efflux antiporter 5 n=1 Tax=Sesamum radiatum TaxID=300843 RepID=A0AAW2TE92_SESRA
MGWIPARRKDCGVLIYICLVISLCLDVTHSARSKQDIRERFYGNLINSSAAGDGDGSIAKMFDRVLEKEFSENDSPEGAGESSFNSTVADKQAELETVAKITHEKTKMNDTKEANGTKPFQFQDVFSLEKEDSDDMTTLIDKKDNVFVMSNKKSKYPVLQVDFRLISDLVVVIVSAAIGGIVFSCLGQPVIVGYLLAGSIIGPGGLKFISEMVQVETVAQFGVVFLLFALGLEFSLSKLKVVGPVAVLGGLLQIVILIFLSGITAVLCGAKLSEGVFVGCFMSMSSTAVVVKFLVERNSNNALHGQVTIGTLIFQDCAVGLLFALLPVLGGNSGILRGMLSMGKLLLTLSIYLAVASVLTWLFVPRLLKLMMQLSSQTNELYQLAAVAFCLMSAWCSDKLGLSLELGSFVAGVMISTTEFAQHTLDQVEPIRNFFAALFLSSIGMLIHVHFLWTHVDILLASVIVVVVVKTTVAAVITKAFGYSLRTSLIVGVLLAQIGEFAFVLLGRASNIHLIEGKMYLLLLGTTALSLPIFHDGMKEWSCCKKRSHDFSLFLEIPGCKTGKHTIEKPVLAKAAAAPTQLVLTPTPTTNLSSKDTCSRCRQGFFCSDHGSQARELNPKTSNASGDALGGSNSDLQAAQPPPPKKIIDINHPQICKNKGCGKTFKERDNHDTACSYHPGPAVFHDRMRGWKCCDIHVKEFDEFMSIPPCAKGWHNADPLP